MSTSERNLRKAGTTAFIYLLVCAFCVLFGWVYEHFSHGVYSDHMVYAFVYPMVGGAVVFLALGLCSQTPGSEQALYHCGIATLTLGSIIRGGLEIYGTANSLTVLYPWTGWLLMGAGIAIFLIKKARQTA